MIFLSYEKKMKEKFIQLLRKTNREGIEDLINFIEEKTDFFTAPASTRFLQILYHFPFLVPVLL